MSTFGFRRSGTSLTPGSPGVLTGSVSRLLSPEMQKPTALLVRKRTSVVAASQQEPALPSLTGPGHQAASPAFSKSCHPRLQSPTASSYAITITPADSPKPRASPPTRRELRRAPTMKKGPGGHVMDTVRALELAATLPRPSETMLVASRIALPPARRPQTIVFDLEETLAHICEHKASAEVLINGGSLGFNMRPYATQCLLELRKQWEIIVFASSERYKADGVLDYLDPSRSIFDHRLYRDHALHIQDVLVKDLRLLSGRDPRRTVIVDNSATAFAFQLDSGIPIKTWRNSTQDRELLRLLDFTAELVQETDMRARLRKTFDLAHLREDFAKAFPLS